jgi:hypothetical protein
VNGKAVSTEKAGFCLISTRGWRDALLRLRARAARAFHLVGG